VRLVTETKSPIESFVGPFRRLRCRTRIIELVADLDARLSWGSNCGPPCELAAARRIGLTEPDRRFGPVSVSEAWSQDSQPSPRTSCSWFRLSAFRPLQSSFVFRSRSTPFGAEHCLPRVSALLAASPWPSTSRAGCQTHAMFRPQVFSTSRRLPPAPTPRACFIPQPRPGFCPSRGFPPLAAGPPHRRSVPPCRWTRDPHRPKDNGRASCPRLRGFDPQEVAFLGFGDQPPRRPLPSSGSVLPQVLLPRLEFRLPETIRS
jgi:hypothetical protein